MVTLVNGSMLLLRSVATKIDYYLLVFEKKCGLKALYVRDTIEFITNLM